MSAKVREVWWVLGHAALLWGSWSGRMAHNLSISQDLWNQVRSIIWNNLTSSNSTLHRSAQSASSRVNLIQIYSLYWPLNLLCIHKPPSRDKRSKRCQELEDVRSSRERLGGWVTGHQTNHFQTSDSTKGDQEGLTYLDMACYGMTYDRRKCRSQTSDNMDRWSRCQHQKLRKSRRIAPLSMSSTLHFWYFWGRLADFLHFGAVNLEFLRKSRSIMYSF